MKPRNVWYTLLAVLLMLALAINVWRREPGRKEAFDRSPGKLEYSQHARCRMQCRQISREDIREIMQKGLINYSKSDRNDRPCPTYVLQGRISSGKNLRVVFAQCRELTRVVTCINLERRFDCHCPGYPKKD